MPHLTTLHNQNTRKHGNRKCTHSTSTHNLTAATDLGVTDIDVETTALVRHLNDADPRDTTHTQTVFVHNKTTRAHTNRRRLTVIILQLHAGKWRNQATYWTLEKQGNKQYAACKRYKGKTRYRIWCYKIWIQSIQREHTAAKAGKSGLDWESVSKFGLDLDTPWPLKNPKTFRISWVPFWPQLVPLWAWSLTFWPGSRSSQFIFIWNCT